MHCTLVPLLRKHSAPKCFGSPWDLFPEPTCTLCAVGAKSCACAQCHHDISPQGSCRGPPRQQQDWEASRVVPPSPGLSLTVWRLAQGVSINRADGPDGPPRQGANQMHKNMWVYSFWLRLPCRCGDGTFQCCQQYCAEALHCNHAAKWTTCPQKEYCKTDFHNRGKNPTNQPTSHPAVLPRSPDAMCFDFSTGAPASHPKLYMTPHCPTSHQVLRLSIPTDRWRKKRVDQQ